MDWNTPLTLSVGSDGSRRTMLERRRQDRERRARRVKFWQAMTEQSNASATLKPTMTISSLSESPAERVYAA